MGDKSKIEWTDASWNPIRARNRVTGKVGWFCTHASDGCRFCYAEVLNRRLGTGVDYRAQDLDKIEIFLDEKMLSQPLRWKESRKIFVCSMTDLFADFVPDESIDRIFAVMALAPQHAFIVLTKRAERMRDYFARPLSGRCDAIGRAVLDLSPDHVLLSHALPLPNVWLGVSVENQACADERIPLLLDTPAAKRFISAEPLLGPVDLTWVGHDGAGVIDALRGEDWIHYSGDRRRVVNRRSRLDWCIAGGESGPGARPMELRWVHDIISQCQTAKVPVFVKQLGSRPVVGGQPYTHPYAGTPVDLPTTGKGGDMGEWPKTIRVREFPDAA